MTNTEPYPMLDPLFILRHTGEVILLGRNMKEMTDKEIADALREIGRRYALSREQLSKGRDGE